jgi:formate dehydrogenase maturation protein FdhE
LHGVIISSYSRTIIALQFILFIAHTVASPEPFFVFEYSFVYCPVCVSQAVFSRSFLANATPQSSVNNNKEEEEEEEA